MNTIDSQHIRIFCTLAVVPNMSRAALQLGLTPSAISHGLKALENDLGCRLFQRTSRELVLTSAGQQFREEADAILERMSGARARLRQWLDGRGDTLRIVASVTACSHVLPGVLREFRSSFPDVQTEIVPGAAQQGIEAILEDEAHLAFFAEFPSSPPICFHPLAEDTLHYLVHPLHRWVKRGAKRNAGESHLILPSQGSGTRNLIDSYFRKEGIMLKPLLQVGSDEAIKQMVLLDLGVGLLPRWMAEHEIQAGMLVMLPIGRRQLRRRWGLFQRNGRKPSFAESVFIKLCQQAAGKLMGHLAPQTPPKPLSP